jgi:hypothetical protein
MDISIADTLFQSSCIMCRGNQGFVGHEAHAIFGDLFSKKEYKIRYKSEYLFMAPPRAGEGP